ncbi:LYPD6 protein, partial [Spizaetus tyrannus]|nr:LYPD6 protein [Spizaetus tyrannus]
VLLLSLLAGCVPAAQPRDFTVKDIVYLHPSTTPYPRGFKCFTCEKAADNYECNRWAPDVYCPRGNQLRASKKKKKIRLATVLLCKCRIFPTSLFRGIGVFQITKLQPGFFQICTSCCEGSICNLPLPRNTTDAVFTTLSPLNKTQRPSQPVLLTTACLWLGL